LLITISGLPGSGTSTVGKRVASRLHLAHVDGGTIFRQLAVDSGRSLAEFSAYAETHPEVDLALDTRLAARGREGDVVLESRLAGWIATNEGLDALRVWISCAEEVRAARVARRDDLVVDAAEGANRLREASERTRYLAYYGIDLSDLTIYDLVVDSSTTGPDELATQIVAAAEAA
jgi:cytidylate kinase